MNFNQLQTFLTIVKQGSVTAAARSLGVSQPAVTQQIRRLETELGAPLLERGEDRLLLTEGGERFRQFAERTVAGYQDLRRELMERPAELRGSLRLCASTIPGEFVVPRLLARFKESHPAIEAILDICDSATAVSRLLARQCEVSFVGAPVNLPEVVATWLMDDDLVLVVPPEHSFARRQSIHFAELAGQPLILRESGSGTMHSLRQALSEAALELPLDNVVMILGSSRAITSAVAAGLGIGFVSALATGDSPSRLVAVPIEGVTLKRALYSLNIKDRPQSQLAQAFVAFLAAWSADPPYHGGN